MDYIITATLEDQADEQPVWQIQKENFNNGQRDFLLLGHQCKSFVMFQTVIFNHSMTSFYSY